MKFLSAKEKSCISKLWQPDSTPKFRAWGKIFPSHNKDPVSYCLPTSAEQGICSVPTTCLTAKGLGTAATGDRGALRSLGKAANIVLGISFR